jgi:hypothetical protein
MSHLTSRPNNQVEGGTRCEMCRASTGDAAGYFRHLSTHALGELYDTVRPSLGDIVPLVCRCARCRRRHPARLPWGFSILDPNRRRRARQQTVVASLLPDRVAQVQSDLSGAPDDIRLREDGSDPADTQRADRPPIRADWAPTRSQDAA